MSQLHFKIHTPNLLKEIADCGLAPKSGVLRVPLNTLRVYIGMVATRCAEINDPVLNQLMIEMTLYAEADPTDKVNYNPRKIDEVNMNFRKYIENKKVSDGH